MPDAMTPLDLDAIRVRADARRDYADERPESLHVPEDYAALADESAADVPALVEEVKRLRSESQRFYENRNLWQKRAEKAEAERDVARAEVARLTARPAPAWDEEAVAEAVRKDLEAVGILPWTNGGARIVRTVLAVVRDHLPVEATCSRGYPQAYCVYCDQAYPCATVRALAAHLDLTDPEGDPT